MVSMVLFVACCRRGSWQGRGFEVGLVRFSKGARESHHAWNLCDWPHATSLGHTQRNKLFKQSPDLFSCVQVPSPCL